MKFLWLPVATLIACSAPSQSAAPGEPGPVAPVEALSSAQSSEHTDASSSGAPADSASVRRQTKRERQQAMGPRVTINPDGHTTNRAGVQHGAPGQRAKTKTKHKRGTIALRRSQTGHLLVPVKLGDRTFEFILDTGASITVITPATRDALGISAKSGVPVKAAGANGDIDAVRVVNLPTLRVAGVDHKGLQAAVMKLDHLERPLGQSLPGILGQNFLMEHRLELDFPTSTLIFHSPQARIPTLPGSDSVDWKPFAVASLIHLRVSIDGSEPFPAVLDLGAGRSIINWKAAALAGVKVSDDLPKTAEPLLGADAKSLELRARVFESLRFGAIAINAPQLFIGDVGVFETLGIADGPAMVLGVDLLSDRRVLIDYPNHKLVVSRAVVVNSP